MTFARTEQLDNGEWITDEEQLVTVKTDFVISAFGSGLYDDDRKFFNIDSYNSDKEDYLHSH